MSILLQPSHKVQRILQECSHFNTVRQQYFSAISVSDLFQNTIHCVSTKKNYNNYNQNCSDWFWWYLAEIFKSLYNRVCMFQFSCRPRFAFFYQLFVFQTGHRKQCQFWRYKHAPTLTRWIFFKHALCTFFGIQSLSLSLSRTLLRLTHTVRLLKNGSTNMLDLKQNIMRNQYHNKTQ